ncbi:MAG: FHA domain-containing protein, partial [Lentisphaerae bacterium]|nr:FHA domain-containing protein [Lentisphaerota bacterium]
MEQPFHVIVEEGPDRDKKIGVPPAGIRLGRSSKNDVKLNDMTMSRFHCRLFWKAGDGLWAADLGSANQTLLNRQPLQESRVRVGDRLTLGNTILKVTLDQPVAGDKAREAAPPAPVPGKKIDLQRPPVKTHRSPLFQQILFALLSVMAVVALAALLFRTSSRLPGPADVSPVGTGQRPSR